MKFLALSYVKFPIVLTQKIFTSKQTISTKNSFIIKALLSDNNYYFGEAAPLINFSFETEEEIENSISTVFNKLSNIDFLFDFDSIIKQLDDLQIPNSLRFAVEQIIITYYANKPETKEYFTGKIKSNFIKINALISLTDNNNIINQIHSKIKKGFDTFKLKMGINNFTDELKLLENINKEFGNKIKIRLDLNGKWSLNEALINIKHLEKFNIEYIEDPVNNIIDMAELTKNTSIPIAVDEVINDSNNIELLLFNSYLNTIIIKPMLYGSIFKIIEIITNPQYFNNKFIISSLFESSLAKPILVYLASLCTPNLAHGLSTFDILKTDTASNILPMTKGNINFNSDNIFNLVNQNNLIVNYNEYN
ncbi:MAG: o-succinylbenzoate synthase [bacterium]